MIDDEDILELAKKVNLKVECYDDTTDYCNIFISFKSETNENWAEIKRPYNDNMLIIGGIGRIENYEFVPIEEWNINGNNLEESLLKIKEYLK